MITQTVHRTVSYRAVNGMWEKGDLKSPSPNRAFTVYLKGERYHGLLSEPESADAGGVAS